MLLKNLIEKYPKKLGKLNIKGLALDSREVKKGYIFFAIHGSQYNGEKFIYEALKKGASLIICSKKQKYKKKNILIIKQKNIKNILIKACQKFYTEQPKNIFLVTGTNGKSSVANLFHQILLLNKIPVASIGTLGLKINKKSIPLNLTSPDIITVYKNLYRIKKKGVENVIIEASSHGLYQKRLHGLDVKAGIFTNLSRDHLDYHKNFKNYLNAKLILFREILKANKYVISDSLIKEFKKINHISKKKNLKVLDINNTYKEIKKIKINLIGEFQLKNLSMAILAASLCNLNYKKIIKSLNRIKNVEGRLSEIKSFKNGARVFIDFAHTPAALENVLKSLKKNFNSKISIVFGCGGDRDFKKRPLMGKIASSFCDKIYITDDNPRFENPNKIRKEIIKGIRKSKYFEISNRSTAIKTAILNSNFGEIILVAGKGHETTQDYGKLIKNISDTSIIRDIKFDKKVFNPKKLNEQHNSEILSSILRNNKRYKFNEISINSKKIKKRNLFVCIKGKNKDGHDFISEAIDKGASYYVSSQKAQLYKRKKISYENTNLFLKKIGKTKREKFNAKIIAITGSAGKTSLKFLIAKLLIFFGDTYFSPKSYNNQIGVPLSLSNLKFTDNYGVFEVGMSKKGEIKNLSNIVKPDVAIITNVAEAHIENFHDLKGIASAKAEIIQNIKDNGTIILNHDDKFFNFFKKIAVKRKIRVVSFGSNKKSNIKLLSTSKKRNYFVSSIKVFDSVFRVKYKELNIYNILASIALLSTLNLDINKILKSYLKFQSLSGRGKISKIKRFNKSFKLIDESYNANPLSVVKSISNLSKLKNHKSKKYVLLGDMLELGKWSDFHHKNLSKVINKSNISKLFVYGLNVMNTYKHTMVKKRGNILQNLNDFDGVFKNVINKNDYLMIKGSNSTGLYKISEKLIKESN